MIHEHEQLFTKALAHSAMISVFCLPILHKTPTYMSPA